jgi:hypothetical protein
MTRPYRCFSAAIIWRACSAWGRLSKSATTFSKSAIAASGCFAAA